MWILWLSLSFMVWGGMLSLLPGEAIRRHPSRQPCGVWRFLRGDMAVGGTVRIGLSLGGAGWWCGSMGLLVSDVTRSVLVLGMGGLVLVALFNAGRLAPLSLWALMALAGFQGAGWVMLILIGFELAGFSPS
ncbi:hypothetical protein FKD06_11395 [Serratia sp. SRS-8-S-2018]|uniref:hypothetical protein n=1 Tax=Serratia sp. SRS-8-S-2018 TaxID=2591107 RepID=UPI0011407C12|nr:hypothetical protein [Serratia sp. SRS-8-S-2018]TPW51365.1 hypothetical protein FKD06_11395 [Serratia sp. SRS-8-S-2018]